MNFITLHFHGSVEGCKEYFNSAWNPTDWLILSVFNGICKVALVA